MSKYAVLKLTATTENSSKSVTKGSAPTAKKTHQKSKELAEVEAELEVVHFDTCQHCFAFDSKCGPFLGVHWSTFNHVFGALARLLNVNHWTQKLALIHILGQIPGWHLKIRIPKFWGWPAMSVRVQGLTKPFD